MHGIDEWHDVLRLLVLILCLSCLIALCLRRYKFGKSWNAKSRFYWNSQFWWCMAGVAIGVQGILDNSDFSPRLVFVTIAAVYTSQGLLTKGEWGGE